MSDRLDERLRDNQVAHDTKLLGDFSQIYCDGKHQGRPRAQLASRGAELGVYGSNPPVLCVECIELLVYAEKRRAFCPQDKPGHPKPFCSYCPNHCYEPAKRELMRDVMRYAGPRSMLHGHAVDGIKHLIEGRKHAAAMKKSAQEQAHQRDASR